MTTAMGDVDPGSDDFGERKGWNRASIVANVHTEPYKPDVSQDDLRLPNEAGRLKTVVLCTVTAVCFTLLYVGAPLYMASLFVPMGVWFGASLALVSSILSVYLSWFSFHETRAFRKLAREL